MSQQLQITGGAKVRNLEGAIVGSSGVLSSLGLGVANGVATLGADGKVPAAQLPSLGSSYKGTWNAATNTPTIANGVGTAGDFYLVSTGGVWNGITFTAGQLVIYSGTVWQQAGGTAGVTSVGLAAPAAFTVRYGHEYLLYCYYGKLIPVALEERGKIHTVFTEQVKRHSQKPFISLFRQPRS